MENDFIGNAKEATDILGNTWHFDCMGCSIVHEEIKVPGGIIYNGRHAIIAADPEVAIPGFLIVNTKRHVTSFSELESEERIEIINIITHAERAIKSLNIGKEVVLVQEEMSNHLHVWIFPYYEWMKEKFGVGIPYLRDIMRYTKENNNKEKQQEVLKVIEKVKEYFKKHDINK